MRSFYRRLEKRLARVPQADFDKPLARPLCEVGYSNNAETRLKMHRKHTESNYLPNLTHAICQTVLPSGNVQLALSSSSNRWNRERVISNNMENNVNQQITVPNEVNSEER